jgi:hypothetical protein
MCGIFGSITGKARNPKLSKFLTDSFMASQVRGTDSSGIFLADTIVKNRLAGVQKLPVCGSMFIQDKAAANLIDNADGIGNIAVGHVRAATYGKVTLNNAHPFIVESENGRLDRELVGVHNGTLTNWASHKDAKYFDVDSEWGLSQIFEQGIEAFRNTIKGAYAFVWWDRDEQSMLNIALNDARPMHIAFTKNDDMLFASEAGMLAWIAERNDIAIDGDILQLTADHHYQFEVGKVRDFTKVKLPKPVAGVSSGSTSNTSGGYTSGYSSYTAPNTCDKVLSVLGKYLVEPVKQPTLLRKEFEAAKELGLNKRPGTFWPAMFVNNGTEVQGSFIFDDDFSSMNAIVRNALTLTDWQSGDSWPCSIIGVREKDGDHIAIVTRGKVQTLQEAANG